MAGASSLIQLKNGLVLGAVDDMTGESEGGREGERGRREGVDRVWSCIISRSQKTPRLSLCAAGWLYDPTTWERVPKGSSSGEVPFGKALQLRDGRILYVPTHGPNSPEARVTSLQFYHPGACMQFCGYGESLGGAGWG